MKFKFFTPTLLLFIYLISQDARSQVGIGTVDPMQGTTLQIDGDGGVLINRVALMGTDDTSTITGLNLTQKGLMVYNTSTTANADPLTDVAPGFYYWGGTVWEQVKDSGKKESGWVALTDANTTYTLPFVNSPDLSDFSNFVDIDLDFADDAGDSTISTFAPDGYDAFDFYDNANSRLSSLELGDILLVRLQFDATPLQNNGVIAIQIDIDAIPGAPGVIIYEKSIPLVRGGNRNTNVSETILIYQLGTFVANGGKIRLAYSRSNNTSGTTCTVSNFSLVVTRLKK